LALFIERWLILCTSVNIVLQ